MTGLQDGPADVMHGMKMLWEKTALEKQGQCYGMHDFIIKQKLWHAGEIPGTSEVRCLLPYTYIVLPVGHGQDACMVCLPPQS